MAVRRDSIMQMVQQLAETFEEVAAGDPADPGKTLGRIDRALADAFRTRPETLHLQIDHGIEEIDERLAAEVGRLLVVRADVAEAVDEADLAGRSRTFAFRALLSGATVSFHAPDGEQLDETPLDQLRTLLRDPAVARELPAARMAEAWETIFEIERDRQHFPAAEDALFHAVELTPDPGDVLRAGIRFYERLLDLPDEVLERRDLPRQEVREGLRDLENRRTDGSEGWEGTDGES